MTSPAPPPRFPIRTPRYQINDRTVTAHGCRREQKDHVMKLVEPPSSHKPATALVIIGRNSRGQWVAQEQNGLYGGLFVSRAEAMKYALCENGHHPETIVELSRTIELDTSGRFAPVGMLFGSAKRPVA
jgi:hypothetical protein